MIFEACLFGRIRDGTFVVSPKDHDEAEHYVRNQEEHHRERTFQDEYPALLTRYGIEFDEQYVWD